MKMNKMARNILTAVLVVSMAVPGYVLAEEPGAKEELEEILERMLESQEGSMLSKDLAFEQLLEAIDENGLQFVMDMGLTENTVETLGLEGEVPEDGRVVVTTVIDPKQKKWMFDTTVHADGEEFVDLSIYADKDLLSLLSSSLYSGAIAVRSGSFKQQFEGSALQRLLEIEGEIPDFDLKFYPDDEDFASFPVDYYLENMEEQAELLEENMRVEKAEEDGQTVYTTYIRTEDIIEIYEYTMDLYLDFFLETGLVAAYELEEFNEEFDMIYEQVELLLGEEIAVDYYVQDGLLQKYYYELVIDPSVIEQEMGQENDEEISATASNVVPEDSVIELEADLEVSDEGGIIRCEILFTDPAVSYQNYDVFMTVADMSGAEMMAGRVSMKSETADNSERTEISMEMSEAGELLYSGTPMWVEYNSETGDLNAAFEVDDGYETVAFRLDSTIAKETGKYVEWQIDGITLEVEGESIGVQGSVLISSEPEDIAAPEAPTMIMEVDDGALMGILYEIMYNMEMLVAEPESEYMDYGYSEVTTADAI